MTQHQSRPPDLEKKLAHGRAATVRVTVEAMIARKSWASFEAIFGRRDTPRTTLREAIDQLGVKGASSALLTALARDTLLALFRTTDAPGDGKLTLCRISAILHDKNVVRCLLDDTRNWIPDSSEEFQNRLAPICEQAVSFITGIVPAKWDTNNPPPDQRLFKLRSKLKPFRDQMLAHSADASSVTVPTRKDTVEFLVIVSQLVDKARLLFLGSTGIWESDYAAQLTEATKFWDSIEEALGSTHLSEKPIA